MSVFSPSAGKYGPDKTPYLGTIHAVIVIWQGPDYNNCPRLTSETLDKYFDRDNSVIILNKCDALLIIS